MFNEVDVPFKKGELNTKRAFLNLNIDELECDESITQK